MGGGGRISMLRIICRIGVKSFFFSIFSPPFLFNGRFAKSDEVVKVVGVKGIRQVSSTSQTLTIYPPFLQLNFLLRLIFGDEWL